MPAYSIKQVAWCSGHWPAYKNAQVFQFLEVIKELINFFVAMTKESHLCHVLLFSSDGYFIERLYNDSKLKKTSELFEVDYLPREDILYWLKNLDKESNITDFILSASQIESVWEHFGGSIWEISILLGQFLKVCRNGCTGMLTIRLERSSATGKPPSLYPRSEKVSCRCSGVG